jgi:hypothetical protein
MHRDLILSPAFLICAALPMLALAIVCFLTFVLPVLQAPQPARIAQYVRKCLRVEPDLSKSELRRLVLVRFAPKLARYPSDKPPSFILFGMFGMIFFAVANLFADLRNWIAESAVNKRIDREVDVAWRRLNERY